jgi:ABC-type transport system involved in multi-copper enzyme maturation permease subunit
VRNLIWKEWHEQSWRLGFGCIVLGALALIGLRTRLVTDEIMSMWVCFLGITLLPVLASTGLLPAERSDGAFESLLAMPIAPWKILWAKTVMGIVLCAGPMIVAAVVSILIANGREMPNFGMLMLYFRSALASLALLIWMIALTAQLPNETRAGLLGLGVLIFWILATGGLAGRSMPTMAIVISPFAFVFGYANGFRPDGPESRDVFGPDVWLILTLAVQGIVGFLLWKWSGHRGG